MSGYRYLYVVRPLAEGEQVAFERLLKAKDDEGAVIDTVVIVGKICGHNNWAALALSQAGPGHMVLGGEWTHESAEDHEEWKAKNRQPFLITMRYGDKLHRGFIGTMVLAALDEPEDAKKAKAEYRKDVKQGGRKPHAAMGAYVVTGVCPKFVRMTKTDFGPKLDFTYRRGEM